MAAFGHLTPQTVLAALDAVGLQGDGRLLQLNSYENRVFRVMLEAASPSGDTPAAGASVVAKFYRPGRWSDEQILEEHDFTAELAQAEVPAMAPLPLAAVSGAGSAQVSGAGHSLLHWRDAQGAHHRVSASHWLGGRDPHIESAAAFERLGRLIGRVHAVGARQRFRQRLTLAAPLGEQAITTLLGLQRVDPGLQSRWEGAAREAMQAVARAFERCSATPQLRLHGDAHRGNLLERDQMLHLVDFDDACNGPAMQDLWLFLDGQAGEERNRQLQALLRGYEDFMDFDDAQLALIEPLRTLRLLRHSAWIAQRWADPAFPIAFPDFGGPSYWADQTVQLQEQVDRMGRG